MFQLRYIGHVLSNESLATFNEGSKFFLYFPRLLFFISKGIFFFVIFKFLLLLFFNFKVVFGHHFEFFEIVFLILDIYFIFSSIF